jgi:molybdate transport system permease protein
LSADAASAFEGIVEDIQLRRGERYARLEIQGVAFNIPTNDPQTKPATAQRFFIDTNRITIWPV